MRRNGFCSIWMIAIVAVIGLVCLAIISRNWSCRHKRRGTEQITLHYSVDRALTGSTLSVFTGRRHRRRGREPNTDVAVLENIGVPADSEPFFEASRDSLQKLSGDEIDVSRIRQHLIKRRDDPIGVVYHNGVCLQLAQIRAGMAWCMSKAPQDWRDAQRIAQKAKVGVWKDKQFNDRKLSEKEQKP